jgi:GTP-binding protein EngB required for normal cell division
VLLPSFPAVFAGPAPGAGQGGASSPSYSEHKPKTPPPDLPSLLLDSRIELTESDRAVMDLLDRAAVTYQIVLTKADGVKPNALAKKQAEVLGVAAKHAAAFPFVVTTSADTGLGMDELRAGLSEVAEAG